MPEPRQRAGGFSTGDDRPEKIFFVDPGSLQSLAQLLQGPALYVHYGVPVAPDDFGDLVDRQDLTSPDDREDVERELEFAF